MAIQDDNPQVKVKCIEFIDTGNANTPFIRNYVYDECGEFESFFDLDLDGNAYTVVGPFQKENSGTTTLNLGDLETVTTLVDNGDDTFTYTNEDGIQTTFTIAAGSGGGVTSVNGEVGAITDVAKTDEVNTFTQSQNIFKSSGQASLSIDSDNNDALVIFKATTPENIWSVGANNVAGEFIISSRDNISTGRELVIDNIADTVNIRNKRVIEAEDPINDTDLTTKQYVDSLVSNRVIVKQASDLINIDSTKIYVIDGKINMGSQQIEVPSGGFYYEGLDYFVSSLFSNSNNYTMFVNKPGEAAGNVRGRNVGHYVSGSNSQLFDLDNQGNFGSIEFPQSNFGTFSIDTTSLGSIANYRQFRTSDTAFIRVADGISFEGTMSGGLRITDTIVLSAVSGSTLFKAGTGLVIQDSVRSDINALSIDNLTSVFDFSESNILLDQGFNLDGARFPIGSNPTPNISELSTKRFFRDCRGVRNTYIGGDLTFTSQTTTPLTAGVLTKALGTTTYDNLVHFSGLTNNEFTYDSTVEFNCIVSGNIVVDGGPNDAIDIVIRQWDNSASSYIDLKTFSRQISNVIGGLDIAYFQIELAAELAEDDRIEIWIRNNTDGTDATVLNGSFLRIEGR